VTTRATCTNPEGFNSHRLKPVRRAKTARSPGYANGAKISREQFFGTQADIFVPAALENQIGVPEAEGCKFGSSPKAANGPCSPEGEESSTPRLEILPDVLPTPGRHVSYYEWVQIAVANSGRFKKSISARDRDAQRLRSHGPDRKLHNCDYRRACYGVALQAHHSSLRGTRRSFPEGSGVTSNFWCGHAGRLEPARPSADDCGAHNTIIA